MGAGTRVILIDLLVERSEFGHGGNQEIVSPLASSGSVEVLLVTPQVQSEEAGRRAQENGEVAITEDDVPNWDDDFGFWAECDIEMGGNPVVFRRIAVPLHGDDTMTADWLGRISPDAVICTGSRHNVSIWEDWMENYPSHPVLGNHWTADEAECVIIDMMKKRGIYETDRQIKGATAGGMDEEDAEFLVRPVADCVDLRAMVLADMVMYEYHEDPECLLAGVTEEQIASWYVADFTDGRDGFSELFWQDINQSC